MGTVLLNAGDLQVQAEVDEPLGDPLPLRFLLTHGAGGDRNTAGLKALGRGLAEKGHLVVRPDLPYRAAGRTSPPPAEKSIPGFRRMVESARSQFGDGAWVVGGRSYGGRVASMAVAEGLQAAGLLLYSYPLHRPGDPSQLRVAHWPRIRIPLLFLEGTHDPFCDLKLFIRHLPELGAAPAVHVVEGGGHSLRVAKMNAPDGTARSESAVVSSLVPIIEEWAAALA